MEAGPIQPVYRMRLVQHSALIIAFLGLTLLSKVRWEWGVAGSPPGPPPQCIEIVLPPPPLREGWLPRFIKPKTQPASIIEGAEATLYLVTAYAVGDGNTPGEITADGRKVRPGITAACRLPLGTMIYIEGIGPRVCEDRGIGPPGVENWIDVAFETAEEADDHGKQWLGVVVIR